MLKCQGHQYCLLSTFYCPLFCLLSIVHCLLSYFYCLLPDDNFCSTAPLKLLTSEDLFVPVTYSITYSMFSEMFRELSIPSGVSIAISWQYVHNNFPKFALRLIQHISHNALLLFVVLSSSPWWRFLLERDADF